MGSTQNKQRGGMRSASRKVLCAFMALCMAVSLCPASALAQDDAYKQSIADKVEGSSTTAGEMGSTAETNVGIAVTSDFAVVVDNEDAVVIDDARKLADHQFVLEGTLSRGVPMTEGGESYYEYKWTREVYVAGEGAAAGSWVEDSSYNEALTWQRAPLVSADEELAEVSLDLYEVRDTLDFDNQAQYRYSLVGRDRALERTSANTVIVACTSHYKEASVYAAVGAGEICATGLLHIGNPELHAQELGVGSSAYALMLQASEGYAVDGAYDLAITEQLAVNENNGHTAYLEPLHLIQIPLSSEVPTDADIRVLGIAVSGSGQGRVHHFTDAHVVEIDGVRYVEIASGATEDDADALLVCGAYAITYKAKDADEVAPAVKVTSQVEGTGGLIDILGEHLFAQGTTVRYTFLPSAGYALSKVVVYEGDPADPISVRTYRAGEETDAFASNRLDYTVAPQNKKNPAEVTIVAHFAPVDMSGVDPAIPLMVDARVGAGEGAVKIEGGSELAGGSAVKAVAAGSAVTIQFIPGTTSVLDYVEVVTGEGAARSVERPQVINDSLTLPAVVANTSVIAYFKWGTPVIYPDLSITYEDAAHGTVGDSSPASVPYGSSVTVQVAPDSSYKTESVWFTFDDDADATRYPLRYAGAGTSWIIDYVLADITVHATFIPTSMAVKVVAGEGGTTLASYSSPEGAKEVDVADLADGIIDDVAASSSVVIAANPDDGKVAAVYWVSKDGQKHAVEARGGAYPVPNSILVSEEFSHIQVDYADVVVTTLAIGISIPAMGVSVQRTDVAGVGAIPPSVSLIEGIDPLAGLALRVSLMEGYENLSVTIVDAAGSLLLTPELDATGAFTVPLDLTDPANTIVIACERAGELPPREEVEVTSSTDGNGTIKTSDKTHFAADEELTDVMFTIAAREGYTLDYIQVSGEGMSPLTFTGEASGDGWTFTLNAAQIAAGYTHVHAAFKSVPRDYYWVVPIIVDESGSEVAPDEAHGRISPAERFQVAAGGIATLAFTPHGAYRVEVAVDDVRGPWNRVDRLSYSIGMDGGITSDTTVYVRFIEDSTAEERDAHTIETSVFGGLGGEISPAGPIEVAHRGSAAFSFIPAPGYLLSYVVIDKGTSSEAVYTAGMLTESGQYLFTNVVQDHTIEAHFAVEEQLDDIVVWRVSAGEHGTASPSGTVNVLVSKGGKNIAITPDEGYVIDRVFLNGQAIPFEQDSAFAGTVFGGTYWLPAVKGGGGTFVVTFAARPMQAALHVSVKGSGGTASPNGDSVAYIGSSQTITFVPDAGYKLASVRYTTTRGQAPNIDITQEVIREQYSHTFTVLGETWVECTFEALGPGEVPPVEPGEAIQITAVSVGTGKISPYGSLRLYPQLPASQVTFALVPDAGSRLIQLTVGERDVTAEVAGDMYTLLAADVRDGDEVRAVFEKIEPKRGRVELTAGSGGQISPAGTVEVAIGERLPITFIPAENMAVNTVELTYMNADGTTYTEVKKWALNRYTVSSVPEALVEVHVTFKEASGKQPPKTRSVRAHVAEASAGLGSVSPGEDKLVSVAQGSAALFTFAPQAGYRVKSATLNGGANLVQVGARYAYIDYGMLTDGATSVLEVAFERVPVNPDYVNVIVSVTTQAGAVRSGIEVGEGGMVSPAQLMVEFGSSDSYEFYVLPDEGYVIDSIEASVEGGAAVELEYTSRYNEARPNDVASIIAGGQASSTATLADAASSADDEAVHDTIKAVDPGDARYYIFGLTNIVGNVDVRVTFAELGDGGDDDAINGGGSRVTIEAGSSEGGVISPSGTVTLPEGCTYPFLIVPDSDMWVPTSVVITYEDGMKRIIEEVVPGRFPITIERGMQSIYVTFEQIGEPMETVNVKVTSSGPGSVSPQGSFRVERGQSQAFTFKYDTPTARIEHITLTRGGVVEDTSWVDAFEPELFVYNADADITLDVVFAEGDERNPIWGETEYVEVISRATTEGAASSEGGTIEPAGDAWMIAGASTQTYLFYPKRGYIVESVTVSEGAGDAQHVVRTLSAEELASRKVTVANPVADTTVVANFIPVFYEVDVTSTAGGAFDIEGRGIQVRQGERLELLATPESEYELERIETSGLVVHDEAEPQSANDQVSRMATLGSRAADEVERHSFAVAGPGAVHGVFASLKTPDDPNNPGTPGTPSDPGGTNPNVQCTVVVSSSGHGEVSPSGAMTVASGSTITLTLKPAVGYYPASITVKDAQGTRTIDNASRTFAMSVTGDCELIANFSAVAAPGTSNAGMRAIRTLQSLAQTGDGAAAMALSLVAVACAGLGIMMLARRRKEEEAAEAAGAAE